MNDLQITKLYINYFYIFLFNMCNKLINSLDARMKFNDVLKSRVILNSTPSALDEILFP